MATYTFAHDGVGFYFLSHGSITLYKHVGSTDTSIAYCDFGMMYPDGWLSATPSIPSCTFSSATDTIALSMLVEDEYWNSNGCFPYYSPALGVGTIAAQTATVGGLAGIVNTYDDLGWVANTGYAILEFTPSGGGGQLLAPLVHNLMMNQGVV